MCCWISNNERNIHCCNITHFLCYQASIIDIYKSRNSCFAIVWHKTFWLQSVTSKNKIWHYRLTAAVSTSASVTCLARWLSSNAHSVYCARMVSSIGLWSISQVWIIYVRIICMLALRLVSETDQRFDCVLDNLW